MKKLIYQVYLGNQSKLYNHCTNSVKSYAERIGADYICQREPILRIKPDPEKNERTGVTGGWQKHGFMPIFEKENVFDYFHEYDMCCVIDADIYIPQTAPDIFSELEPQYAVGSVYESDLPMTDAYAKKIRGYSKMLKQFPYKWSFNERTGHAFFNSGVMLYNSQKMLDALQGMGPREFLEQQELADFINGKGQLKWQSDQITLNYWFKKNSVEVKHLDWKWNALYTAVVKEEIKNSYFFHFFLKDKLPDKGENVEKLLEDIHG